jgi:hypothetical protein
MSAAETESLIASHEGRLCGRLYQRRDGTILTENCPVGFSSIVKRISRVAGAALSAAISVSAFAQTHSQRATMSSQTAQSAGGIKITVVDGVGAEIPRAHVTLVNETANNKADGSTDSSGNYEFSNLSPGSYVVTVAAKGFRPYRAVMQISSGKLLQVKAAMEVPDEVLMGVIVGDGTVNHKTDALPLPERVPLERLDAEPLRPE